jgi:hypothetical protein
MAIQKYLTGANVVDLSGSPYRRGNGPFSRFLGVCLHVNVDENGTPVSFWERNPGEVTPNFQVFKNGRVDQLLPFNWQPWCQVDGNFNYAAIETAGLPNEPLTPEQIDAIAGILSVYHRDMGLTLAVANTPGAKGLIVHSAGGAAWGGHSCPGVLRAAQRAHILDVTRSKLSPMPGPQHQAKMLHRRWPKYMGQGDFFGLETGGRNSHGGFFPSERADVAAIQDRLHKLGFYHGGDMRGHFRDDTRHAVANWQKRYFQRTTTRYGEVWQDDWNHLFTY